MTYTTESVFVHRARCKTCGAISPYMPDENDVHAWMREHDDDHGRQW